MESEFSTNNFKTENVGAVIFNKAIEGMVVVDRHGSIQLANPSLLKMFGYAKKEILGQKVEILVPDLYKEKLVKDRKAFTGYPIRKILSKNSEFIGKRKDGSTFPIEISMSHFKLNDELMIMALVTNVTEKSIMIKQLKKEKHTAETYLQIAETIILIVSKDQTVSLINKKGCEILGYKEEEVIGKNWFDNFLPENVNQKTKEIFKKLLQDKSSFKRQYQNSILTKRGDIRTILWHNTWILDENGDISGTLSSGEDITDLKKAEEKLIELNTELEKRVHERTKALEESNHLYRMIAKNIPKGVVCILNRELKCVFIEGDDKYKKEIGCNELLGDNFITWVDEDSKNEISKRLKLAFEGDKVNVEIVKEQETYMMYAVGIEKPNEPVERLLMVIQNITSLKKAEKEIKNSLIKERQLNEMKSRFVSMASHEFQTPLTTIMNSAILLSKIGMVENHEDKQLRHINRIKSSVHQLSNILNEFLSLDQLEEGRVKMNISEFNILEFTKDVVDEMADVVKKGQRILYRHLGKEELSFDKLMLKKIYQNLLSNAIKYSPENSTTTIETRTLDNNLFISIEDEGIGIPENDLPHLFERFFRAKNALNIGGTGLGLNIVKKYLDSAKGKIEIESKSNVGTIVKLAIPLFKEHSREEINSALC